MKKQSLLLLAISFLYSATTSHSQERAPNPIVTHMYTADPSAHVWDDGRLYVYPSTDIPGTSYSSMDGYHVFSTDDMVTWQDHGEILHSSDLDWGIGSGWMWAPDAAYKNGTYYYYFPHPLGPGSKTWKIGVATSSSPASGFTPIGWVEGIDRLCDPCVFVDDDGQAYIYAVNAGRAYASRLKENMVEIEGSMTLQVGLDSLREGPFTFKRNGIYYMMYPEHTPGANQMTYAMSDNPLGPWVEQEIFLESTDVITTHGSIVEYKGQWYIFYHNGSLSGGVNANRSICFDKVTFNADGTINIVEQTLGWSGSDNLALSGTASQSSTAYNGVASRAIDGNTSGIYGQGSVTHTATEANPWWEVDLGAEYSIGDINIFNRVGSTNVRLSNFTVYVYDSDDEETHSESFDSYPDPSVTSNAGNVMGQRIRIELAATNALSLAEVQVMEGDGPPVGQGLVAHWALDESSGSVASDMSGNGHDGSVSGASWINGFDGNALDFNGSNSNVSLPSAAFSGIGDEFTIAMWVNGDLANPTANSIFYAADAGGNRLLNIHLPWSNGKVYFDSGNSSGYNRIQKSATAAEYEGSWHHWVFTKNASTGVVSIYLDGALWHTGSGATQSIGSVASASLGSNLGIDSYNGAIDDVLLYDTALTAAEVETLYLAY